MGSLNLATIIGHVGADSDLRYTAGGTAVTNISVATTEVWTKNGVKEEKTSWHRVTIWGKTAEALSQYLKKGRQVSIVGKIEYSESTDDAGVKRHWTNIRADRVVLLGGGGRQDRQPNGGHVSDEAMGSDQGYPSMDDDPPF